MRAYWPGANSEAQHFCPACWRERTKRTHRFEAQFVGLTIVGLIVAAAAVPIEHGGALGRLALMILIADVVATVLHELGHAIACKLMGHRVFVFSIGLGLELWRKRIGGGDGSAGTDVRIHLLPTCGFVMHGSKSLRFSRLGHFVIAAAGPAVNFALVLLALYMVGGDLTLGVGDTTAERIASVSIWHVVLGVNALIVVMNVIPMSIRTEQSGMPSSYAANDGMSMILALTMQGKVFEHMLAQSLRYQLDDLFEKGEPDRAVELARATVTVFPYIAPLRVVLADTFNRAGNYDDARFALDPVILYSAPDAAVDRETRVAGTITGARIELDDPDGDLPTADHLSERAAEAAPHWPDARIERARALVATGWVAKGVEQLAAILGTLEDDGDTAECCCHLATAELEQGDTTQAERYVELARSLDPKCRYLPRLDEALAAPPDASA